MKKAFTLAEVLITLGIIGVVAALTLPSIVQNYQKRSLEVATQKFYSAMSQAIKQYMADEGVDDLRQSSLSVDEESKDYDIEIEGQSDKFFQKYLKAQICEEGCFADNYKTQADEISSDVGKLAEYKGSIGRYVLPDGMVVDSHDWGVLGTNLTPGYIYVDINGRKGPNKIGYDLWSISVYRDGVIDEGGLTPECRKNNECFYDETPKIIRDYRFEACKSNNAVTSNYGGCFGHFLENGFKFDY